ncbi:hypothetical protein ABPG72_016377 [Tetrahymena utriculariae]
MKLITVFGITSILSLLFVSIALVLKQDSSKQLTEQFYEDASCFKGKNQYKPYGYIKQDFYVMNICPEPKKFIIIYEYGTWDTGCLRQNGWQISFAQDEPFQFNQVIQSDC